MSAKLAEPMIGGTIGRERGRRLLAAVALLLALVPALGGHAQARAGQTYVLDDLGDFQNPVFADNAPGAPNLLFVVEQRGVVQVLEDGQLQDKPFLDISSRVQFGGEQGLLSIAFHPNYASNRRFYVYYINEDAGNDIEVDQYRARQANPLRADRDSRRRTIIVQHNQADNHNGGQLQFGDDGDLYMGTGDGGPQGDPENDAQDTDRLLGKILRISPRGSGGYEIPPDNPYVGGPGRNQIFALGLRNPYRFSLDSADGALTIGDVGGDAQEEVDYEPDGGLGANFGWNDYEGFDETGFGIGPNADPYEPPILDYDHSSPGSEAISGGYVIHDPDLPALAGRYIYADFYDGALRTLVPGEGGASGDAALGLNAGLVSGFGEGANGQIYVVDYNGNVYALEPGP